MYPIYVEITAPNLVKLFLDPMNAEHVDKIVFEDEYLPGAYSEIPVPDSIYFKLTENERTESGVIDLGKDLDFYNYNPFLKFLSLSKLEMAIDELEVYLGSHEAFYELKLNAEPTITSRVTVIHGEKSLMGFDTDKVCYGISGYRLPVELKYIWNQIEAVFTKYPDHIEQFMELFRNEIIYYYRIYIRKNGDLFMTT